MAGSTISLDSLSSPSPSLSPPPESNKPAEPTSAGLNSDSELSELTEEEQEADKRDNVPRKGIRNSASHRGGRPSRRGGRRKTSSIVPAPMWGWAETRPSANVVEEEEEEEMAGPPRAMEEEEDEEGGRDDEEEEEEEEPDAKQVGTAEDDDPPAAEGDEDESISGDDDPTYRSRRSPRKPNPDASMNGILKNGDDIDVDADDDVDETSDAEALPARTNEPESEDENGDQSETEDEGDDDKDVLPAADADEPATTTTTPMELDVDVDVTAPQPQDIAPLAAAAAASSIMAGSGIIDPPSPSSSQRSTPASSRSNSPPPGTDGEDAADVNAGEEKDDDDDAALVATAADVDAAEQEGAENDQEAEDGDIDDTNPDDADNEVESDLQPAHRAEALDVLATIELKFALLRERVYVEKMENLAWEEALVNEGTHPELLHLQSELSTRRDKRIELATRKRLLEVANVNKRRRTDEDGIWSWWKFSRDDLQTEMIAETNRKRRRMERERRVNDRHQPVRAIPPANQEYPPAQPLRKVVKSIAFSNMRTKSSKKYCPPRLVYPELSSLSEHDVAYDMECIFQTQRERSRVSMPLGGYDLSHVHRVPSAGAYPSNGPYMIGAGHVGYPPVPHSHQLGYSDGGHMNGTRPYLNGVINVDHRIPPFPQGPPPQHVHPHLPPPPQPVMPHSHTPFTGPPGSRNIHMQQPQQHPPPVPLHSSHGHHSHAPSPHNATPPFNSTDQDIPIHSHHTHNHAPPHTHGSSYYLPRRSPSPAGIGMMQNSGSSNKMGPGINGGSSWMGSGMGMDHVYTGSGPGKGTDWGRDRDRDRDGRSGPEEDERERMAREMDKRERERERDQREREIQHRERERDENERERHRDMHHLHHQPPQQHQQIPHRHQAPQHLHLHPGSGSQSHHHMNGPHYHHRPHHHHVLHHHHQPSSGAHSGHPNSLPQGVHSPRSLQRDREREREYDNRPPHPGHNHPTEVINLTSSKPITSQYHDQHLPPDYRDIRSKHGAAGARTPSSSGLGSSMMIDDKDRPPPMSFALPPSHGLPPPNHGPPPGSNSLNGRMTPPRNSWNTSEDKNHRVPLSHSSSGPPPGYHNAPHESGTPHTRSPNQAHRYTNNGSSLSRGPPPPPGPPSSQQSSRHNSIGLHSPPRPTLPRPPVPPAPASPTSAPYPPSNANPNCSPSRLADPRSPPINLKMRPPSPPPNKMPPYAVLSGPGRTSTPALEKNGPPGPAYSSSRSSEAMMSFQAPGRGYVGQNGMNDRDRDKERERERDRERERPMLSHFGPPPPPPMPSKMSVPQMVDGH
ncbi:hypothetical protein C0989_004724 [Termitomyces sp. Mn162]|nr:hypothetical protein C0989_004724 [Termitomyces sp. Mn162]